MIAIIVIIIIIVTSVFCIRNSFNISITEKIKQYGMLASVGATSRQIKKNVYYEAFLLGIIGIPLGIIIGIVASYILIIITNNFIGSSFVVKDFLNFSTSIGAIVLSIILSVITIYWSARKGAKIASKISPIQAIRNSQDIKIKSNKLKTPKIISKLFGIGGVIAYKNVKRNKKKYRTTVISIIVCVSVYVALSYFINTAFKVVKMEQGEYTYNIEVYTYTQNYEYNKSKFKEILQLDGIRRYVISENSYITVNNIKATDEGEKYAGITKGEKCTISIISLGNEEYCKYLKELHLNYDDVKEKGILINNSIATIEDIDKNERKTIEYNLLNYIQGEKIDGIIYGKENYEIEIAKITNKRPMGYENAYGMPYIVISDELMGKIAKSNAIECFIDAENPDLIQDKIEKIFESDGESGEYNLNNIDANVRSVNSLYTIIAIFLYGFIIVIALIGITNIFNTITTNMDLRAGEFATLKSIGMTSKEFNKMIYTESFIYCFKSLLIGLPIGIILSYLIYSALRGSMVFDYELPYNGIIISIIIVFILIFTLMKYSVNKIKNKNIIETIRDENI